jgi:dihydropyrimidinase
MTIAEGRIREIGDVTEASMASEVIDADGLLILPGLIDAHTHYEADDGAVRPRDDYPSGSACASAGGVTTFINFAAQRKGEPLLAVIQREHEKARRRSHVDYSYHVCFGTPGKDWQEDVAAVVAHGVASAKVFTTYRDTNSFTSGWDWYRLMVCARSAGLLVQVHSESDDLLAGALLEHVSSGRTSIQHWSTSRPAIAEIDAVARGITLSRMTGGALYVVHASTAESIRAVQRGRREGLACFVECCSHHLTITDDVYRGATPGRFLMAPPLRSLAVTEDLCRLVEDLQVDVLASDHVGLALEQRGDLTDIQRVKPGIPGTETLWPVLYTRFVHERGMAVHDLVRLLSWNPAVVFGLLPRKGQLAVGADGDFVLFDPRPSWTFTAADTRSRAGYSAWEGMQMQGRILRTVSRGKTVYLDGTVTGDASHGEFVPARPFDAASVLAALRDGREGAASV